MCKADLVGEDSIMNESEKKRLKSLKEKRNAFKLKKQTIQNDLQFIDSRTPNKKIVFDNDIIQNSEEKIKKNLEKKNILFNSDDENQEQFEWNEDKFNTEAKLNQKLCKLQMNFGNDKRFILDERFIDDQNTINTDKDKNENDEIRLDEKKCQSNSLGNNLEKCIKSANNDDTIKKKNTMIRYDPNASDHKDYEIIIEKSENEKYVKKKRKVKNIEINNDIPVSTSKELFYDVSENLVQTLQNENLNKLNEQFSLLKTFGLETTNTDNDKNKSDNEYENEKISNFQNNYSAKKFKYDSSDTESDEEINEKNIPSLETKESIRFYQEDKLFFSDNDPCFDEARNFFKIQVNAEEHLFKYRRRELKEIVRLKIRRNLRKSNPWNKKRICKIQKNK